MTLAETAPTTTTMDQPYRRGRAVDALLRHRATLPPWHPDRHRLRHEAVEASLPIAVTLARRYANRGEPLADLKQVAFLGLIKAVDGFDPAYVTDFWAYATPTITGELKRYFRDSTWSVRVPRRYKDLQQEINACRDELMQRLGRRPVAADFAEHLDADPDEVAQALRAENGYSSASLFAPARGGDRATMLDRIGSEDPGYELVELHESIHPTLARLPSRERRILTMRFFGNMTQSQIAAEVGVSQMHVSRLLARVLTRLRRSLPDVG